MTQRTPASLMRWKDQAAGYAFLAPSLIVFGIFVFYPLLQSVYLSLHMTDPQGRIAKYVGLQNYMDMFASPQFYQGLKITGLFIVYTVPVTILWALLLAAMTHGNKRGMKLFRFVFSLPVAISVGTSAVIWLLLFHPSAGMLNYFLSLAGVKPIFWLSDPHWALLSISIMTVWMSVGFVYIVLLGGLNGISQDIWDSLSLDGANPMQAYSKVVLPLLSPSLFFVSIVSVIGSFQAFGQIHILTKGGPMNQTNVIVYQIYQEAFINYRFGTGSAQALVLFAIILILTAVQFRVVEKKVHYQ
ncbi:carbohydrate ABC transporter permease [Paenibacillus thermotolerans]|uniref:carbohydrate ABC transporter permease n=1 Tax=Paenibacillus thermotolerans TaxID=3027807 RepID=UPI002368C7B6|nr:MULTISPECIES: sugar ABC transporter permease [unclassified Paenibacillus]